MHIQLVIRRSRVQYSCPAPSFCWDWSWNLFYGHYLPFTDSRREVVSYLRKNVYWVLFSRLGISLPWKSVVRLTDHSDMTIAVYHGRWTTTQQQLTGTYRPWWKKICFVTWVPSEGSDQSVHLQSLIYVFAVPMRLIWHPGFPKGNTDSSNNTEQMLTGLYCH